ncbi:hypothetical protein CU097_012133, partial [Rhizopus azygosporus]
QLFKIVTKFTNNDSICFQIDEYKLESIKHKIHRRGGKAVELSLLEVTGPFGSSSLSRNTKYHIKRSFGTLTLLQQIGHLFELRSLEKVSNLLEPYEGIITAVKTTDEPLFIPIDEDDFQEYIFSTSLDQLLSYQQHVVTLPKSEQSIKEIQETESYK